MSKYAPKKRRATKKVNATKKKTKGSLVRKRSEVKEKRRNRRPLGRPRRQTVARKPVTKRRAVARKTVAKKAAAKKAAKRRPVAKKPVTKRRAVAKKAAAKVAAKKRPVAKKPVTKRRAVAKKVAAKKRPVAKKAAAKKRPAKAAAKKRPVAKKRAGTRSELLKQLERLRKEASKLRKKLTIKQRATQKKKVRELREKIDQEVKKNASRPIQKEGRTVFGAGPAFERFQKRFSIVRKKALKAGEIPKVNYRQTKIDSKEEIGRMRALKLGILLRGNVYEVLHRVEASARRMKSKFGVWIASYCVTAMGERLIGSGNTVSKTSDPDAQNYQIGFESTGVWTSLIGMLDKLEDQLTDYASEEHTMVMIEWIKIRNFEWK